MKSLLREPLLHFLVIGAALFLYFHFSGAGSAGPGSTRIVLSSGQIAHLEAGFTRTWSRPPTEAELKGLIDDWVREEVAVRRARHAGLSWAQIGTLLGVTRQTMHRKYRNVG